MKQIALSFEQMERLERLGLDTSTASCRLEQWGANKLVDGAVKFLWSELDLCIGYNKDRQECSNYRSYPTFTLQDLLDIIPPRLDKRYQFILCKVGDVWIAEYSYGGCEFSLHTSVYGTALEAAFDMLVWVAKSLYLPKKFLKKTI